MLPAEEKPVSAAPSGKISSTSYTPASIHSGHHLEMLNMAKPVLTILLDTFRTIARNLLAKTKVGQVNWVPRTEREYTPNIKRTTIYEVVLPGSRIVLSHVIPLSQPDRISLQLLNANGVTVDSWTITDPEVEDQDADSDGNWKLLSELYSEVHRFVTGWDKVTKEIQSALLSSAVIGEPRK